MTLLRHSVATLAYRAGKALRGAPADFGSYRASDFTRTPVEILAHMGDLIDWALTLVEGRQAWHDSAPLAWDDEVARFFKGLETLDRTLAAHETYNESAEKLFQGPIADALTHTGQISMLRRMAGSPVKPENYHRAEIVAGRVGPEQAAPRREF